MKKHVSKGTTVAPLTARAPSPLQEAPGPRRDPSTSPWLTRQVAQRLEEGRSWLIDMATDLPFSSVLRGRVSPPKEDVLAQAEPFARVIQHFSARLGHLSIDAAYIRERHALLLRLSAFEQAGENFIGLIKRTRAVMAAQLEKAMRAAFAQAQEAAADVPELARALQPLQPLLSANARPPKRA